MKRIRKAAAFALVLAVAIAACGCTVSSGTFIGMAQSSTDKSLSASYMSFDGSLAQRVSLAAGDKVTFSLEGGEGLSAAVLKDGERICDITAGGVFTAPGDGTYDFGLSGKAENGSFSLSWQIE